MNKFTHSISHLSGGKRKDVDMTVGNIPRHLILFALPLLAGNIFQQLYNTVDTWVVGNYVSDTAFSAVGGVTPFINMFIGFFMGLSAGAGVVISQLYGAKQFSTLSQAVHTSMLMTAFLAVALTAGGLIITPQMLHLMKIPAEVLPEAELYLRIYYTGIPGMVFYNIAASILRAVGDSRRPFYYLVVTAVVNTVLDLVFVLVFHMGVEGVALATVISLYASAFLAVRCLLRTDSCVKVELKKLRMNWNMLGKIVKVGVPAALQMAVTAFANVFTQSYINSFGKACMGGWTAYSKVDQFLMLPAQSIALSSTTFVGQNLGIGQVERTKKGARIALALSVGFSVLIMIPILLFPGPIVSFFNGDPEVIDYGILMLRWITPFYLAFCFNQIYAGVLRGSGDSTGPTVIMLLSFVVFRQIYMFLISRAMPGAVVPIIMGYPIGWALCSLIMLVYYLRADLTKHRVVEDLPVRQGLTEEQVQGEAPQDED